MWTLTKRFSFEAAHYLPYHAGACAGMHGHRWNVALVLESHALVTEGPETGMVMDFGAIKQATAAVLSLLDHKLLNEVQGLDNPTSENLAAWIFERTCRLLPFLRAVQVEETAGSSCEYRP